jgi:hypothetical protein
MERKRTRLAAFAWPSFPSHGTFGATIAIMIDIPGGKSFSAATNLSGEVPLSGKIYTQDMARMYEQTTVFAWMIAETEFDITFLSEFGLNGVELGMFSCVPPDGYWEHPEGRGSAGWR